MTNLYETGLRLWTEWTAMWNGRPELARQLVAPSFTLHLPTPSKIDPATVTTPEAVERWVIAHRKNFAHLTFQFQGGPFVDVTAGVVAGPWAADISVDDATPKWAVGMDTIAFRDGKITEYWTLAKESDAVGLWTTARTLGRSPGAG